MAARPRSAVPRSSSRTGFGQRESIGNPLNLTLGRRPASASATRRTFGASAARVAPMMAPEPPAASPVETGYFVPAAEAVASLRFVAWFEEKILERAARAGGWPEGADAPRRRREGVSRRRPRGNDARARPRRAPRASKRGAAAAPDAARDASDRGGVSEDRGTARRELSAHRRQRDSHSLWVVAIVRP